MEVKVCYQCKKELEIISFSKKKTNKDGLSSNCKECNKINCRAHYAINKKTQIKQILASRKNRKIKRCLELIEYFKNNPCKDCGETDPLVLEFDHRIPSEKSFNISDALGKLTAWALIQKEMVKCDVRCSNCHKRKTAKDQNWHMYRVLNDG